jgi:hypothetical protein
MCLLLNHYGTFALRHGAHMQSSTCSFPFNGAANTLRITSSPPHRLQGVAVGFTACCLLERTKNSLWPS